MEFADIATWVKRSQAGDREAFGDLVRCSERPAMVLALGMLGNRDMAQDVVQDSFVKAFVQIRRLRDPDRFQTWFFRIVNNTAVNKLRSLRRQQLAVAASDREDRAPQPPMDPAHEEQARELGRHIQAAMTQLSPKEARAIALIGLEDMSYEQAASVEGCSQGALRWQVFRARKKLKHLLEDWLV